MKEPHHNQRYSRCLTEFSPTGTRPLQPERDGLAREVRFVVASWEFFLFRGFLRKPVVHDRKREFSPQGLKRN